MSLRALYFRFLSFILIAITLISCNALIDNKTDKLTTFTCNVDCKGFDADEKNHQHFFSDGDKIKVNLGGGVTEKESHEGTKSVLLTSENPYGLTVRFEDAKLNQYYKASVWRKDKSGLSGLVVHAENAPTLYVIHKKVSKKGNNGWELLEYDFEVPPKAGILSIYCYAASAKSAYFDQLTISRVDEKTYTDYNHKNTIGLHFSDKKIRKFEKTRATAFEEGIHFNDGKQHKGILYSGGNPLPIKARFKGDWLDHLKGKKWSFRIKLRKGNTFRRLREFSIQTPKSRHHLHEYLSHQLLQQEGLLTTRYDFVPVRINQQSRGLYALEEHFTKQLIESSLRREGPILKFDENPMWRNTALYVGIYPEDGWSNMPNYKTSRIKPFGSSKVIASEKLKQQFLIGHSLVAQLKNRTAHVDELFEVDKLAKYLALTDIHAGTHGATWHNLRFYYNPISCKLEIINYDNFTPDYSVQKTHKLLGLDFEQETNLNVWDNLFPYLFSSSNVVRKYIAYLEHYSQESFVIDFYKNHEAKIKEYLPLIQDEFPLYSIDSSYLINNAKKVRAQIPELKAKHADGFFERFTCTDKKIIFSDKYWPSLFPHFINAYYSKQNSQAKLRIENFNNRNVRPKQLLDAEKVPLYNFTEGIVLENHFEKNNQKEVFIPYFESAQYILFEESDSNLTFTVELTPWQKNTAPSPYQTLIRNKTADATQMFKAIGDTFLLTTGEYTLPHKIYIPQGKVVIIEKGTSIDLIQEAAIVSESPVYFEGTAKFPIKVFSSDKTANGIAVLKAQQKSKVEHTTFSDLNTFTLDGWELSGAVNFYESEVEILHSTFEKNHCEDALNIIRTDFIVSNCTFSDIFADAFDSDFCTGKLSNSIFNRVGNDAIDFSTSQIHIENCTIKNINDKGISGGEGSTLWVKNTTIEKCNIGTASKDLSEVSLTNVTIKDSKYGLVLLQKKPEYGPALIKTQQLALSNCEEDLLIEKKSVVELEEQRIEGDKEKVAEMFY